MCFLCTVKNIKLNPVAVFEKTAILGKRCKEMAGEGWGGCEGGSSRRAGWGWGAWLKAGLESMEGVQRDLPPAPHPAPIHFSSYAVHKVYPPIHHTKTAAPTLYVRAHTRTHTRTSTHTLSHTHSHLHHNTHCSSACPCAEPPSPPGKVIHK